MPPSSSPSTFRHCAVKLQVWYSTSVPWDRNTCSPIPRFVFGLCSCIVDAVTDIVCDQVRLVVVGLVVSSTASVQPVQTR